jgi:hypothetical protein
MLIQERCAFGDEPTVALDTARAAWIKEPFQGQPGGEGTTAAVLQAWRDIDPFSAPFDSEWLKWAERVAAPLARWWSGKLAMSNIQANTTVRQ